MDPYYRTMHGFAILIEKEWCSFGHQFGRRHGHGFNIANYKDSQRSPIFTQYMHCLVQILRQFPTSFEFNEELLIFLLEQVYSCRFGTFLFDNERQRVRADVFNDTVPVWAYVFANAEVFTNKCYIPQEGVIDMSKLRTDDICMVPWREYHKNTVEGMPDSLSLSLSLYIYICIYVEHCRGYVRFSLSLHTHTHSLSLSLYIYIYVDYIVSSSFFDSFLLCLDLLLHSDSLLRILFASGRSVLSHLQFEEQIFG